MTLTSASPLLPSTTIAKKHIFSVTREELCQLFDQTHNDASLLCSLQGVNGVCKALAVDTSTGLSPDESFDPFYGIVLPSKEVFVERRELFGENIIPSPPSRSIISLAWDAYNDQTLLMLTMAAVVSLAVGVWQDESANHPLDEPKVGWVDGVAIITAVIVVVVTNTINDYEKEKQFQKLNAKRDERFAKVLRRGVSQQIPVHDLVVGDILLLEPGDMITVDCLYIDGHNLRCDESAITGESEPAKKRTFQKGDCRIYSGSKVLQGVAKVVVVAVGVHCCYGQSMAMMCDSRTEITPLQRKLNVLTDQIAKLGLLSAVFMFLVLFAKVILTALTEKQEWITRGEWTRQLISIIIQAITVIVVAVPEGLPMAVTLALAFATTAMLKDNNLVRHLSACETMGNATVVCSDKTGTLTENKMTVVCGIIADKEFERSSDLKHGQRDIHPAVIELLAKCILINSTAYESPDIDGSIRYIGSTTECSLLEMIRKLGVSSYDIRNSSKIISVFPFDSTIKSMTTVIELGDNSHFLQNPTHKYRLYCKGAAEILIQKCTQFIDSNGHISPITQSQQKKYDTIISQYTRLSLRVLVIAFKDVTTMYCESDQRTKPPLSKLTLLGIVGIRDPIRPGVIESIEMFKRAGVFIRMITGDNLETAKAIAKECGILTPGGIAMSSADFRSLTIEQQYNTLPRLQVLARSTPADKVMNEVVAMTGDGTNDGPALKLADIGFAMGIVGTDVAKEASDIILMNDNFNAILQALKWGRTVNDGVRKFLTFQLTVNISAVVLSIVSAIFSQTSETALSAVQLLWVNMIMDTLAALALATEPFTDNLVDRKPLRKDSSLINRSMSNMIIGQAIFQTAINLLLMAYGAAIFNLSDSAHDRNVLRTIIFNTFVFLQVFNELNCRRIDGQFNILQGITHDRLFIAVQVFVITSQVLIVQRGGLFFKTVPLTFQQWLCTFILGFLSIPAGMMIRWMPYLYNGYKQKDGEFIHAVTYTRMRWEDAINRTLRRCGKSRLRHSVPFRSQSTLPAISDVAH